MAWRQLDPEGQLIPFDLLHQRLVAQCAEKHLDLVLPVGTGPSGTTPRLQQPRSLAPGAIIIDDTIKVEVDANHADTQKIKSQFEFMWCMNISLSYNCGCRECSSDF